MDSLSVSGSLTLGGGATGIAEDAALTRPLSLRITAALASTGSGASLANDALFVKDRTLAASGDETFDLTSFTSVLRETGATMSKVRIFVVVHDEDSAASSIKVGGAGTPWAGIDDTAAAVKTLLPGHGYAVFAPTATALAVSAGQGIRVRNQDATNAATYSLAVFGE
jgi:hypothetical protein